MIRRRAPDPLRRGAVVVGAVIVLLGVAHASWTFQEYSAWGRDALWFFGGGLTLVLLGLLNLSWALAKDRATALGPVTVGANVLAAGFQLMAYLTTGAPQPLVPLACITLAGVLALLLLRA